MTIKDIAKIVGVSPSTVSRVVNKGDTKSASDETQKRIWEAVYQYGYMPSLNTKNLQADVPEGEKTSGEIVCMYGRMTNSFLDPFFQRLTHAIEKAAFKKGYILRFSTTNAQTEYVISSNKFSDALIILGRTDKSTLEKVRAHYKHILCTGLQDLPFEIDQVVSSGYKAAQKSIQYLIELGHKKICYVGETKNEQRFLGYQNAMKEAGLEVSDNYVVNADFSPGKGYEAVNQLIEKNKDFTAIFCSNDIISIGALKALKEHHYKIPEDVSLISVNDIETVQYLSPTLTTVHIPLEEMGTMAAKLIIDRIEGGHRSPMKLELPNSIIRRESCGPCCM